MTADAATVLDELERRIRHQAAAAQVGSMEWRAHFADLAHLEAVRMEYVTQEER